MDKLEAYFRNGQNSQECEDNEEDQNENEFQVEHILMQRNNDGKTEYLIQWRGYDQPESTWEPEENLEGCKELLKAFQNQTKCFCGGPGYWYDRMLECQRCKHWFHESCITCLKYKLIPGDEFYCYVCEYCNESKAFLHRLPLGWKEIAQLALFNLFHSNKFTPSFGCFFDYEEHITPWINRHWVLLQCPSDLQSIPKENRSEHILKALQENQSKFKCGTEKRKKKSLFALRNNTPPSAREIILPDDIPITEASMDKILFIQRAIGLIPVLKTFKVDDGEWENIPFEEIIKSKMARGRPLSRPVTRNCGECEGCCKPHPCRKCVACQDKRKFGGPGRYKKKCYLQMCEKQKKDKKKSDRLSTVQSHLMEGSSMVAIEFETVHDRLNEGEIEVESESLVVKCEPFLVEHEDDERETSDTYLDDPDYPYPEEDLHSPRKRKRRLVLEVDKERFINEIERRPVIWDLRCNNSNKFTRREAWDELCEIFIPNFNEMESIKKNTAAEDLQRKYKTLRDTFRREFNKTKLKNAKETKYKYYKQLSFLLPICRARSQDDEASDYSELEKDIDNENQTPPTSPPAYHTRKKKTPASKEDLLFETTPDSKMDLLFEMLAKHIERKAHEKKLDDPENHFLLSLLPYFKSLSEDVRLEVQMEFLIILKNFKQHAALASQQFPPRPANNISSEDPAVGRNPENIEQLPPSPPALQNEIKTPNSEELLFQTLTKTIESKAKEKKLDGPDKYFLLSLLPYFKSFSEDAILEIQMEFLSTLKRSKQQASSQQFPPTSTHYFPGSTSMTTAPHSLPNPNGIGPSSSLPQQTPTQNIQNSYINHQSSVSTRSQVL